MAQKDRCDHKGCIHQAKLMLQLHNSRNSLGIKHKCCGACCPKVNGVKR